MSGRKSGFDLTRDEHDQAEKLIGELQDRLGDLRAREDDRASKAPGKTGPGYYEPPTYKIEIGDDKVVIKDGQGKVTVDHNNLLVVDITGKSLDMIDFEGLDTALDFIRRYMVLDDLASI